MPRLGATVRVAAGGVTGTPTMLGGTRYLGCQFAQLFSGLGSAPQRLRSEPNGRSAPALRIHGS